MSVLQNLEPKKVFEIFEAISAIPRGSGNTAAVAEFCRAYGEKCGFESRIDKGGNVIIKKPATAGYENAAPVVLQGHFDMVAEKTADCPLDMEKDGLRLMVDGDWVTADGTTLGGDDGIAVAMGLALLEDESAQHPPLELLFTRDEETGMFGAIDLEAQYISGRRLLNIDSEEEGVFTVSCAGGINVTATIEGENAPVSGETVRLTVEGLVGGHSGVEIHHGRGNAYVILGRLLAALDCRICSIGGGGKPNAIARRAEAVVCVEGDWRAKLEAEAQKCKAEFAATDAAMSITAEPCTAEAAMTAETSGKVVKFLASVPDGVVKMSGDIPGLVQTSLNCGILQADASRFEACISIRSSVMQERDDLAQMLIDTAKSCGSTAATSNGYPAWEYCKDSPLRELMVETYTDLYGEAPKVVAIHAGLECGILAGKLPGLESVSIGPNMKDIHTPEERLSIASTQRVWNYVKEVLKRMK